MLAPVETDAGADARPAERRGDARQRLILRTAKLRCRGGEYLCVIHDVSETGVRLRLFHAHPPDSHMFLELANGELYAVERRWSDGAFAGYAFSSRIDIDEFVREKSRKRRRPVRLRVAHPVEIAAAGERGHALLVNLSQHGACIDAGRQVGLRTPLMVDVPGCAPRLAHVCWRRNQRHGLAFQEALTPEDLARLALRLQPFGAEPPAAAAPADPARAVAA